MSNNSYSSFKKLAKKKLCLYDLPKEIEISTMTICCKIDTIFNLKNIAKYVDLEEDGILSVSYGYTDDEKTNRTIIPKKNTNKKKIKQKKAFFNQVSMYIYSPLKKKKKSINLKIFSNGAFQMTGCQSLENVFDALDIIINKLSENKIIINKSIAKEKPFSLNPELINLENLKNLSIAMINSNFKFPTKINRTSLNNILKLNGFESKFDPTKHASVNIKYYNTELDKNITILVFEGGSILITGAKNCEQVNKGYNWINCFLLSNINLIVKFDKPNILNFIKKTI